VRVQKSHQRRVRIAVLISRLVVTPVNTRPARWATLKRGASDPGENASQPAITLEAFVRQQSMIANANRKSSAKIKADKERQINLAGPEPETQKTAGMKADDEYALNPIEL